MNTKTQLSFREFFVYEFLERALQKVNEINDVQVQKFVVDFVKAIRTSADFIEGIETLAQFPGTSDLSIFFADILENLSIYNPEEINSKLDELSDDLIEMFKLLKNDENWVESLEKFKAEVGGVYAYAEESKREKVTLEEFCDFWLKSRFNEFFAAVLKEKNNAELGKKLFQSLFSKKSTSDLLQIVEDRNFNSLLEQFDSILEYKRKKIDDYFVSNFYQNVDSFLDDFFQAVENKPQVIEEFLSKLSEIQLETLEEKAKGLEEKVSIQKKDATLEPQLEGVLSEYLTKEFLETLNDITDIIEELSQSSDEKLWNELEDNAGYLIEMGSIHNVRFLELLGQQLKDLKDELIKIGLSIDNEIKQKFDSFIDELKNQITDFKTLNHALIEELINNNFSSFKNMITEKAIAVTIKEDKYSLESDYSKILNSFQVAHQYYWELISKEYAKWLSHRDRQKEAERLSGWLEHLRFWYSLLGFSHILPSLAYLDKIFTTLQYGEVSTNLDAYIQEFLMTMPERPEELLKEKIDTFVKRVESQGITLQQEKLAFHEVKKEVITLILNIFEEKIQTLSDAAYLLDHLTNTISKLTIANEKEVLELLSKLKSNIEENYEIWSDSDFNAKIKHTLNEFVIKLKNREYIDAAHLLDELNDKVLSFKFDKELKKSSPTITLVEESEEEEEELESLFHEPVEEEKEEVISQEPEELTEEDLKQLFFKEAEKYIDGIKKGLNKLKEDPTDGEAKNLVFKNAHALKGSSKMMGFEDIGNLLELCEDTFEKLIEKELPVPGEIINHMEGLIPKVLKNDVQSVSINELKEKWTEILESFEKETEKKEEEELREDEFVILSEQDQDLLQIFEEEAKDVIKQLKGISKYIQEFTFESKVKNELMQSLHKIDSAAKMLGFSEIALIIDKLQEIVNKIEQEDEKFIKIFGKVLNQSVLVVEQLSREKRVKKEMFNDTLSNLDNLLTGKIENVSKELSVEEIKVVDEEHQEPSKETIEKETELKPSKEIGQDVIQLFINEVNTTLEKIRDSYLSLEINPDDKEKIYTLFRQMHTLKGAASMVNMVKLQELSHKFEDVLEQYYNTGKGLPVILIHLIQQGIEEIEYIVNNIQTNQKESVSPQYAIILKNMEAMNVNMGGKEQGESVIATKTEESLTIKEGLKDQEIVKIPISKLDELLNNSVELVITNNELLRFINKFSAETKKLESERKELTELKNLSRDLYQHYDEIYNLVSNISKKKENTFGQVEVIRPSLENLMKKVEQLYIEIKTLEDGIKDTLKEFELNFEKTHKISNRLYDYILQVRMVPISLLFDLFPRAVEEIAKKFNKKVKLKIEGGETELDRSMVEHLFEPLLHIIRNSIDHGIEPPEIRKKKGKSEEGIIHLSAKQEKDSVVITISDDGEGIDFEKIRKKIVKQKFVTREEAKTLSNDELLKYLFMPGFTTKEEVSEISGRGIGLDVVERQVRKVKGEIKIETEKGKHTTFYLKFPITLSVTQCILCRIEDTVFGIPIYNVENTFDIKGGDLKREGDILVYEVDNINVHLLYLNELVNMGKLNLEDEATQSRTFSVIMVRSPRKNFGLLVDKIDRRAELIVKPLSPNLHNFPYISGGAVLPDASIALILDIEEIVEKILVENKSKQNAKKADNNVVLLKRITQKQKIPYTDQPTIMLIDDSESVRAYMMQLLEKEGFEVQAFSNVKDAREHMEKQKPDLIIVDLELPEISGYEFVLNLSSKEETKDIPFMFFTGKKVEVIENLARDLNALGYILKPFDEKNLLKKLKKLFVKIEK